MINENSRNEPLVSIVIVCLNEGEYLRHCLSSIEELDYPREKIDVVIVDGGSKDSTLAVVKEFNVNFISAPGKNIPISRNMGALESKGDIIAYIDGDCVVSKNWIRIALSYFESCGDVLVGSPAVSPDFGNWVEKGWDLHWQLKCQTLEESCIEKMVVTKEPERLMTTRNLLMTKNVYNTIGGFDEELATGEDYAFCYTAGRKGIKTFCDRSVLVTHLGGPKSISEFFEEELWHSSNKDSGFASRLYGGMGGGGLNPLLFAVFYMVSIFGFVITVPLSFFYSTLPLALNVLLPVSATSLLACRTVIVTKKFKYFPALFVLYSVYGIARAINITNLFNVRVKKRKSKLQK